MFSQKICFLIKIAKFTLIFEFFIYNLNFITKLNMKVCKRVLIINLFLSIIYIGTFINSKSILKNKSPSELIRLLKKELTKIAKFKINDSKGHNNIKVIHLSNKESNDQFTVIQNFQK